MANEFSIRDAGKVMLRPRGRYNPNAVYEILDMVSHEGASYVAINNEISGIAPSDDGINWQLVCQTNVDDQLDSSSANAISNRETSKAFDSVRDALKLIGIKNLLDIGRPAGATKGVSYNTSDDGITILNGMAIDSGYISLINDHSILLKPGKYHFSGCPAGGSVNTYYLRIFNSDMDSYIDFGDGVYFDVSEPTGFNLEFVFGVNSSFNNFELKPMITYGYDSENSYDDFEPYHKGATVAVDEEISSVSKNPVQNKVIYKYINDMITVAINDKY